MVRRIGFTGLLLVLYLSALLLAVSAANAGAPQVVPVGTVCNVNTDASLMEQSAECISNVYQRPAFQFGLATGSCNAGYAGMVQWTGAALQYCNGTSWTAVGTAASTTLDAITAATGNQAGIANGAYTIVWNWDTLAGGSALKLASTSTAAASNAQKMLEIALSGSNGTSTQTTYDAYFTNTHTGTSSTNVGLYASASGGTNNYAGIFAAGNVGIGTTTPGYPLEVGSAGDTSIKLSSTAVNANTTIWLASRAGSTTYSALINSGWAGNLSFAPGLDATSAVGFFKADNVTTVLDIDTTHSRVGIGTTPANTLDVAGTVKLGTAGTAITAMGVCTVASYTPTNTATNVTCTGVPASASVAVSCSPSAAFQAPNSTVINVRATGTVNQLAVNLSAGNNVAVTLTCMWVKP